MCVRVRALVFVCLFCLFVCSFVLFVCLFVRLFVCLFVGLVWFGLGWLGLVCLFFRLGPFSDWFKGKQEGILQFCKVS